MENTPIALLKVIAQVLGNALGGGIAGNLLIEILPEVAKDTWEWWSKEKDAKELRAELESIANLEGEELNQKVIALVSDVTKELNLPANVQETVVDYLNQMPAAIRRSMRRPTAPTGKTIPNELVPNKANDLLRILPTRLPRFKEGDRPLPGVDRELDSLLGVGGFGEVWKAHNPVLNSADFVALKFCLDPVAVRTLRSEAALIDRVMKFGKHPGIVQLLNTYLAAENPCLEYECVEGGDLGGLILSWHNSQNPPKPNQIAKVMLRLTDIVAVAHEAGIVHRDLKPSNILTVKGSDEHTQFKIADFGIGGVAVQQSFKNSMSGGRSRLQVSAVHGSYTPLYASPQQMKGEPADKRDDIFSLGVIWHQFLTGDLTMGSPTGGVWKRSLREKGMSSTLIDLLESCLEQDADHRPEDAKALLTKLSKALTAKSGPKNKTADSKRTARTDMQSQDVNPQKSPPHESAVAKLSARKSKVPWISFGIGAVAIAVASWIGIQNLINGQTSTVTPTVLPTSTAINSIAGVAVVTSTATVIFPTLTNVPTEAPTPTNIVSSTLTPQGTGIPTDAALIISDSVSLFVITSTRSISTETSVSSTIFTPTETQTPTQPQSPTLEETPNPTRTPRPFVAPTSAVPQITVELIFPVDRDTVSGKRDFSWRASVALPEGFAFEPLFWSKGQDSMTDGFGWGGSTTQNDLPIDLTKFLPSGEYRWGVFLVRSNPYSRVRLVSSERIIYVKLSNAPGPTSSLGCQGQLC